MANEINTSTNLTFSKNGSPPVQWSTSGNVTVAGSYYSNGIVSIGTADESLPLADVGTIGFVCIKNLDATNFVLIGADGTNYPLKLLPGEECKTRWNGAAVHAKADTAACKVAYLIVEA